MISANSPYRSIKTIRWIARSMSILVFIFVLMQIFIPESESPTAIPFEDWLLLSFWFIAVLGLIIAWKWEYVGAWITIGSMVLRELAWVLIKGSWMINFLIFWVFVIPPAILYLMAWQLERNQAKI